MAGGRMNLFIGVCCGLVCVGFSTLTFNGQEGVVHGHEGEDIHLVCDFGGAVSEEVRWTRNTQDLPTGDHQLLAGNANTGIFTLTILNVTRIEDDGHYSCGTSESNTFAIQVIVYYFPPPGNPMCDGQTEIREGGLQTFTCKSASGQPAILPVWTRDDTQPIAQDEIRETDNNPNEKQLHYDLVPSRADTGVNLTCTITNAIIFPGMESSCRIGPLTVSFPPSDVNITDIEYMEGNTSYDALFCNATAFPTDISYEWRFNVPLNSSQLTVANDSQVALVNITSCYEHPITATCVAANAIGDASTTVTVCEPPPPTTTTAPTTLATTTDPTTQADSTIAPKTSTNPPPLTTDGPQMTTPMGNDTKSTPEAVVLTPALYAVIVIGACMVIVTIVILTGFAIRERDREAKKKESDEVLDNAYNIKSVRSLSIAYNDTDDNEGPFIHYQNLSGQDLDNQGLPNQGLAMQGLDDKGLDNQDLDNQSLDSQGLDNQSLNNQGLDNQGLNNQSFDKQGLDNQGLDSQGLDNQSFDNQGLDNQTLDNQGLPNQGLDNQGFDNQGTHNQDLENQKSQGDINKKEGSPQVPNETEGENGDEVSLSDHSELGNESPEEEEEEEVMVAPAVQDEEDPRKSLVQEALLAVQVNDPSEARGDLPATHVVDM